MINKGLFSSNTNEWATPQAFFDELNSEFHFDLDPCATSTNHKCDNFYTIEDDGLTKDWGGGGESFLQSPIRQGDRQVGQEMLRGSTEAGHLVRLAHTGQNGHGVLPRLHLPQGARGALHPRPTALQRKSARRSLPVYGGGLLGIWNQLEKK